MNKNKKGFTLMELLAVIVIVTVVSVSATISFSSIDDSTKERELENKYSEMQRAAGLYLDLHNSYLETFIEKKEMYIKLYVLQEENYITNDIENPVTGDDISLDNYVKLFVTSDGSNKYNKVDTCIVSIAVENDVVKEKCIANSYGKECEKKCILDGSVEKCYICGKLVRD